jgi:hypothetical protein
MFSLHLFQHSMTFTEDCLLSTESGKTHNGQEIADDELTPTKKNVIVLTLLTQSPRPPEISKTKIQN